MPWALPSGGFGRAMRLTVALVLALVAAAILTGTSGTWAPTWLGVGGSLAAAALYLGLGRSAGWWSIPIATATVFGVGAGASALFYDDQADIPPDNRLTGIDAIGVDPANVTILLPVVWVLLVLATLSRRWPRRPRTEATA